jgi:O-antigen/teichoic acid export membrane protein
MSNIRRQSIFSSVIIYFGFALGFLNTYFFTRQGRFSESDYGIVSTFIAIANIMLAFSNLGMPSFIHKFYPYYKDNLAKERNDLVTLAIGVSSAGFLLVVIAGYIFKDFVLQHFTNAPELIKYYDWLFPFGFGLTIYSILEAYAWQEKKSVLTNFLREVLFRIFTTILIVLFFQHVISTFEVFVKFYAFTYVLLTLILLGYLLWKQRVGFHFQLSRVTKKFSKKILALCAFVWGGGLVFNIATAFDTLVIAAVMPKAMLWVGVYSLAQNITSLIQAPQRGIVSAAIAPLSRAWKEKNMDMIGKIYKRSSISQLIFSTGMFALILMNFKDGIHTFSMKETYLHALPAFFLIGAMRIIDMGTGVNAQIMATSVFWRFEFLTGVILFTLTLPLNYYLTRQMGVMGTALSNLITFTIYNFIRCIFLWRKIHVQPFSVKSIYTVVLAASAFLVCYLLFNDYFGIGWIVVRSLCFIILFGGGAILLKLSPDLFHVMDSIKNRLRKLI